MLGGVSDLHLVFAGDVDAVEALGSGELGSRFGWDQPGLGSDDAISHGFLSLTKVVADLFLIVPEAGGDFAANLTKPFEVVGIFLRRGVRVHGSTPRSSYGVMSFGGGQSGLETCRIGEVGEGLSHGKSVFPGRDAGKKRIAFCQEFR